jgi:tetratricopeptide (TPR) repeat protein
MAIVVVACGIQSFLDYTFYFPGIAIPVLLCAGWLAGRGPLDQPVGRRARRVSLLERPGAGALVTGLASVALIAGWMMWQPLRSAQAMADAENHPGTAFASARAAASRDPLSIEPLNLLSVLYQEAHDPAGARAELVKATQIQPDNPQSWLWLGQFDYTDGRYQAAISELEHALSLDLPITQDTFNARTTIQQATAQLAGRQAAAAKAAKAAKAAPHTRRRAGHRRTPR